VKAILVSLGLFLAVGVCYADTALNFLKGARAGSFEYFYYDDKGEKKWKLTGEKPTFLENDDIRIEKPVLLLYSNKKKKKFSKIKADFSILKGEQKMCFMQGNVSAFNIEGFEFESAIAKCDMNKEIISFPKEFKVIMNEIKIKSNNGVLDMNKKLMISKGHSKLEYIYEK